MRTKIHYKNGNITEVDAIICGVEICSEMNEIKYKIRFELDNFGEKRGSTGCVGYVRQDDILELIQSSRSIKKSEAF